MAKKQTAPKPYEKPDQIRIEGEKIYSPLRKKWVQLTPEERIRQEYLIVMTDEYGYSLEQIAEETPVTGRGSAQARADFLIWRTPEAKQKQEHALIVIECKADNVTISLKDYEQGAKQTKEAYTRYGVGWEILCKRFNHSSPAVTMRYLGIEDKEVSGILMTEI